MWAGAAAGALRPASIAVVRPSTRKAVSRSRRAPLPSRCSSAASASARPGSWNPIPSASIRGSANWVQAR